jgi:hypothetical protein
MENAAVEGSGAHRYGMEDARQAARRNQNQDDADIFDEIYQHYHDQQQQHIPEQAYGNERDNVMEELIDVELSCKKHQLPKKVFR